MATKLHYHDTSGSSANKIHTVECNTTGNTDSYTITNTASNCSASGNTSPQHFDSKRWFHTPIQNPQSSIRTDGGTGTDDCNEGQIHNNAQKAIFHAVKGAKRFATDGLHEEAARIAATAGRAFLLEEDIDYDDERSSGYLADLIDALRDEETKIEEAINKAFTKIDSGNHKGGARIAVSIGDEYLNEFSVPE